ncbi:MAG: hypothetical protein ABIA04_00950 [Pseudomonadota bacterium]
MRSSKLFILISVVILASFLLVSCKKQIPQAEEQAAATKDTKASSTVLQGGGASSALGGGDMNLSTQPPGTEEEAPPAPGEEEADEDPEDITIVKPPVTIFKSVPCGDGDPDPDPVTPDPVTPDPVTPEPVTPEPVTPEPVTPGPVTPEPVTPEPVTPEPVVPQQCEVKLKTNDIDPNVKALLKEGVPQLLPFDINKEVITDQVRSEILTKVYPFAQACVNYGMEVVLIGHASKSSTIEYNLDLSFERANSYRELLIEEGILSDAGLRTHAYDEFKKYGLDDYSILRPLTEQKLWIIPAGEVIEGYVALQQDDPDVFIAMDTEHYEGCTEDSDPDCLNRIVRVKCMSRAKIHKEVKKTEKRYLAALEAEKVSNKCKVLQKYEGIIKASSPAWMFDRNGSNCDGTREASVRTNAIGRNNLHFALVDQFNAIVRFQTVFNELLTPGQGILNNTVFTDPYVGEEEVWTEVLRRYLYAIAEEGVGIKEFEKCTFLHGGYMAGIADDGNDDNCKLLTGRNLPIEMCDEADPSRTCTVSVSFKGGLSKYEADALMYTIMLYQEQILNRIIGNDTDKRGRWLAKAAIKMEGDLEKWGFYKIDVEGEKSMTVASVECPKSIAYTEDAHYSSEDTYPKYCWDYNGKPLLGRLRPDFNYNCFPNNNIGN